MKPKTQHEIHPDAERLSAFAEQALGERERGEVLEHLAVCGRCRQVVALAREAGEAEVARGGRRAAGQPQRLVEKLGACAGSGSGRGSRRCGSLSMCTSASGAERGSGEGRAAETRRESADAVRRRTAAAAHRLRRRRRA